MKRTHILAIAVAGALLTGCGSQAGPAAGEGGADGGAQAKETGARAKDTGGCPLTVAGLSEATSLTWELREKREDHPLETMESVRATACLYTAADAPQDGSDPLALRVDVVTGDGIAKVREEFEGNCGEFGGKLLDSAAGDGSVVCKRNGTIVEGLVGGTDRLVNVYLVNAGRATAAKLTPAFDKILAAVDGA
ncbi:hypothetical protein ACFV0L_07750 [Streptosporangium canum]|uniref:hypothetical protein n=1 Tax=Streptosporangium canum TaxID=324952 RepID=UPI003695777B